MMQHSSVALWRVKFQCRRGCVGRIDGGAVRNLSVTTSPRHDPKDTTMSKTTPVQFRGRSFWAFDVSLSILLAELIDIAEALGPERRPPWLAGALPTLRLHAAVGDLLFSPDLGLQDGQLDELIALIAEATRRLRQRRTVTVTAAEAAEWIVLDDQTVLWRPADAVDTEPIAELGEAVMQLLQGTLPSPPLGTWWYFGLSGGPQTVAMRDPTSPDE
jgi:hypothetical protein